MALVCAGTAKRTALNRLPELRDSIILIKGSTSAAASRAANAIGRGKPVCTWQDLAPADILAFLLPDTALAGALAELLESELPLDRRIVLLLDSRCDSSALSVHEAAGAWGASIDADHSPGGVLLVEGHREAMRKLRSWLRLRMRGAVELRRGGKARCQHASELASTQLIPLLADINAELRGAGMGKAAAQRAAASLVESRMQAWFRAGRRLLRP